MSNNWSTPTTPEIAARRAGGRRHYNAVRRFRAMHRRNEVARMLLEGKKQIEIARYLRVSPSTISRDVALMERLWWEARF